MNLRYFNLEEFDSPDAPGSGEQHMDEEFLTMLDKARHYAGVPFVINSGYRTRAHNRKVGGSKHSSHMNGMAADISCTESRQRAYIIGGLLEAGFNRIGIGQTFIHADNDPEKPEDVVWTYY
jgi:hypothetical protein